MQQQLTVPRRGGWRPGPTTPYPFLPSSRRYEWFVFYATPVGACLAINDGPTDQHILIATVMIASVFIVPAGIRQLMYRLPQPAGRILEWIAGGFLLAWFATAMLFAVAAIVAGFLK